MAEVVHLLVCRLRWSISRKMDTSKRGYIARCSFRCAILTRDSYVPLDEHHFLQLGTKGPDCKLIITLPPD